MDNYRITAIILQTLETKRIQDAYKIESKLLIYKSLYDSQGKGGLDSRDLVRAAIIHVKILNNSFLMSASMKQGSYLQ